MVDIAIPETLSISIDTSFRAHDSLDRASSPVFAFHLGKLVTRSKAAQTLVLEDLGMSADMDPLYVGEVAGRAHYAVELNSVPQGFELNMLWDFQDAPGAFFETAGRALQILNWDRSHLYCGACSSKTVRSRTDWSRHCSACGFRAYPRLSPCVIMAIRKGSEILLAQRPASRHQLYTVLAGFVEPGESAEQCVRREVAEEVGIEVKNLRYFSSQPWPFPGQLMLGFIADYDAGELQPDLTEVQNAGWFDYQNLPDHPGENTISGRLIRQVVAELAAQ